MSKVSFCQIQNISRFFDMLERCAGAVFIASANGEQVDIRNNPVIRELLIDACKRHGIESLNVTLENSIDLPRIINYLMECRLEPVTR